MSILAYLVIAIAAIVLVIVSLFYIVKGFLILLGWFVKLLPFLIKSAIYWGIVVMVYSVLRIGYDIPALPSAVYPILYFVIMGIILVRRYIKYGFVSGTSGNLGLALLLGGIGSVLETSEEEYKGYVLNKKSKVIHEKCSDSAETISPHHRKALSYSEATQLTVNSEKYRFKKDT